MDKATIQVKGMSCNHCVSAVEGSVGKLKGVRSVEVNLAEGTVMVDYEATTLTLNEIKEEIEDQGYDVV
ncbi:copper(I) chaperone CopZ [Halalkalibacter wakoensis JCM 9140]|uniref:Copper chaperone CopZ n=1 Tax=Halalkalibacter wakoensis JCM 9140 TaxID=1236970 RepID=W4PXU6_9BACI|nr:copper chaperone CopZ [Halalkalibacter wakoensis]GAE24495.1 copper(I) chaperone CopZ [Halalkalibacter wakoensis JCM 9140]